jgi:hypothetical protein
VTHPRWWELRLMTNDFAAVASMPLAEEILNTHEAWKTVRIGQGWA